MFLALTLLLTFFSITPAIALTQSNVSFYAEDLEIQFLRDTSAKKNIHDVRNSNQWQTTSKTSFGLDSAVYWFHFTLPASHETQKILEIRYPFLDDIQLCTFRKTKQISFFNTGSKHSFEQRPIAHRNFAFPLSLSNTEKTEVYLRVQNNGVMHLPLKIWSTPQFQHYQKTDTLAQGFFIGALLMIVFYSFVLFITMHYIEYFHYAILLCCFTGLLLVSSGIGFQLIWPKYPLLNSQFLILLLMLKTTSACLLNIAYLKRKNIQHTFFPSYLRYCLTASATVIMLSFLMPYTVVLSLTILLTALICIFLLYIGYTLLDRHDTSIYYYNVCWFILLLLIAYEISSKLGLLPISSMDHYLLQLTGLVEAGLLVFILQRHIQKEKQLRLTSEHNIQQLQQQQTETIENAIIAQTQELETNIEELTKANAELSHINQFDSLTNVFNRHCFNLRYKQLVQQAIEDKEILSLIIVDIDHFKNFNDSFGHHVGDQCLRKVAQTLQTEVHRSEDMLFRYGGEEFVVILPNTIHRGAFTIAERMREAIENVHFMVDGAQVPITISGGVASLYLHHEEDAHTLFNFADTALYEAKNSGRNQVNIFSL